MPTFLPRLLAAASKSIPPGDAPVVPLTDYSGEAANLFGNMQSTAAFIAGGLVPLSSFASPQLAAGDSRRVTRMKRLHMLISSASLVSELIAVVYATVSKNMLVEAVCTATLPRAGPPPLQRTLPAARRSCRRR